MTEVVANNPVTADTVADVIRKIDAEKESLMNLQPLFETQKILDQWIVEQHGLQGQYLLPEKILALQVELGELANEWRGFKFWSKDRAPHGERECQNCGGECHRLVFAGTANEHEENCWECNGNGTTNKLLEEYVDCLHFILSIGLEIDCTPEYIVDVKHPEGNIAHQFLQIQANLSAVWIFGIGEVGEQRKDDYTFAFSMFMGLGEMLGFTWSQIEQAYYDKNTINHTRQATGY